MSLFYFGSLNNKGKIVFQLYTCCFIFLSYNKISITLLSATNVNWNYVEIKTETIVLYIYIYFE